MLWVSRMPFVLARERYLPRWLADSGRATATPGKSILVCCVVFTLLVPLGFIALIVLDVFFYMGALVLEMSALLVMRRRRPDARRPVHDRRRQGRALPGRRAPDADVVRHLWPRAYRGGIKEDFVIAVVLAATTYPAYALCRRLWGGPPRGQSVFDALASRAQTP